MVESGRQAEGFDVDIANALCDEMNAKCTIVKQDWDGIIPALLAQQVRRHRRLDVDHRGAQEEGRLHRQVLPDAGALRRKKGAGIEITAEGLKGKRIGVQRDTIHEALRHATIPATIAEDRALRHPGRGQSRHGRRAALDLLLADSVALLGASSRPTAGKGFEFVGPDLPIPSGSGQGAGIAVRKQDTDLRDAQRGDRRDPQRRHLRQDRRRSISTSTSTAAEQLTPRVGGRDGGTA